MSQTVARRLRDPSTRTARAIRRRRSSLVRACLAGWVLFVAPRRAGPAVEPDRGRGGRCRDRVGVLMAVVARPWPAASLLRQVERLDQERHGLREAFDRARLDSLRDGLTGLGNHRAFQEELTSRSRSRGSGARVRPAVHRRRRPQDRSTTRAATRRAIGCSGRPPGSSPSNLRRWDRGFRIGGDEFAVVLLDCDARRGRHDRAPDPRLRARRRRGRASAVDPFSVTIGVSAFPQPRRGSPAARPPGRRRAVLGQAARPDRRPAVRPGAPRHGRRLALARGARGRRRRASPPSGCSRRSTSRSTTCGPARSWATRAWSARCPTPASPNAGADVRRRRVDGPDGRARPGEPRDGASPGAARPRPRQYLSVNLSPRSLETEAFNVFELLALCRRHGIDPDADRGRAHRARGRRGHGPAARVRWRAAAARDADGRRRRRAPGTPACGCSREVDFDIMKIDLSLVRAGRRREARPTPCSARCATSPSGGASRSSPRASRRWSSSRSSIGLGFDAAQGYLLGRPSARARVDAGGRGSSLVRQVRASRRLPRAA